MNEYQQNILERRVNEAKALWQIMESDGFTEATVAALDFTFFSNEKPDAEQLIQALQESYTAELVQSEEPNYWYINATTRPYGNEFSYEQWLGWVEYMVSLGFSHNSVFSTWSAYAPKTKITWSSENIEVE